jgi:hypothetical protein
MNNPRNHLTTEERNRQQLEAVYIYAVDLIDAAGWTSRYWFRDPTDRQDFADLFNHLHTVYGHRTRAVLR